MFVSHSEKEKNGEKGGLLEEDEEGWAILSAMGSHSLGECKHLIRDYMTKIYRKPPSTWMEMYLVPAKVRPCPEHYCENPRACVHRKEVVHFPTTFLKVEDLPQGILLRDPSHHQEEVLTLWDFFTSHQKDGNIGLIFSGCDLRDKRKDMGKNLSWKAKGRRPNLSGYDCSSSSSSDEEYSGDEVGPSLGSLTKGKGKSVNPKDDNN